MKFRYLLYCFLLLFLFVIRVGAQSNPLEFIENKGQWACPYQYEAITNNGDIYLEPKKFTYLIGAKDNDSKVGLFHHGGSNQLPVVKFHSYNLTFKGANTPIISGNKQEQFYVNYFIGNNPSRWKSKIHPYMSLSYTGLYNGIDMNLSSSEGNFKYEMVVSPQADVSQIQMVYNGQDYLKIKDGNIIIGTSVGEVTELKPYAYQYINDNKVEISCKYRLDGNMVTYAFPDGFDAGRQLIIDPTVVFATFSGSKADNWGYTATYDENGNFYNGGIVHTLDPFTGAMDSFIVTPGAYQTTFAGGVDTTFGTREHGAGYSEDIGIVKYNSTGTTRLWATFLGGSDNETPHSMVVDENDNLYIAGRTYSHDFPVTSGAYNTKFNGGYCDMFIAELDASGSSLLASTYIGGSDDDGVNYNPAEFVFGNLKHNYGDDARSEILLDKKDNVYVTASTISTDFPTTKDAYQKASGGNQDAVVVKLNSSLTTLLYSTYLGGSNDDAGYVLELDTSQTHLFVAGGTMSSNFPTTGGTLHSTALGGIDGYIVKFLNTSPYTLQAGTLIGTTGDDQCYGIQIDMNNGVYVMGQSLGGLFPVTSGVYSNAHSTQFIMKLDSNLTKDVFSTVYGSGDSNHTNISPVAFLVDTCQNVYISGWGGVLATGPGISFPTSTGDTHSLPITSDAAQSTTDGHDFYFIVFSRDASSLLYATYMGGTGPVGEHVDGGTSRFDKYGVVYQAICGGCGGSSSFPTTPGAWSTKNASDNCNEIALKIAFQLGNVVAKANASPNAKGCAPFTVKFKDSSLNAINFTWNFGDGTTDTAKEPTHTFTTAGIYKVRLVTNNPKACKQYDTAFLAITVDTTSIHPDFTLKTLDSCTSYAVSFANTSVYSATPGSSTFTKFLWLFGDGTSYTGVTPPVHNYPGKGSYTISLVMTDSTACNSPDTIKHTVGFSDIKIIAKFSGPDTICKNATANFIDSSVNAVTSEWIYGDGNAGSAAVHEFDSAGTFTVTLIINNPLACKGSDTFRKTITVMSLPTAAFTFSPVIPVTNMPTSFTNQSLNAISYQWDFGDGVNSKVTDPVHQYKRTGTYNVCLTASNKSNCPAKVCQAVSSDIRPLADLPTAFSPNGDGSNDILLVRGGAIEALDLKIFNRWGQVVFETKDQSKGWDGTFNGQPQPMDAYAFVLNVTFIDASTFTKKGNVTLLR